MNKVLSLSYLYSLARCGNISIYYKLWTVYIIIRRLVSKILGDWEELNTRLHKFCCLQINTSLVILVPLHNPLKMCKNHEQNWEKNCWHSLWLSSMESLINRKGTTGSYRRKLQREKKNSLDGRVHMVFQEGLINYVTTPDSVFFYQSSG